MSKLHRVQPGECLAMIAEAYGLLPRTIWEHPDNEALREERRDGHVLLAGDVIAIPDRQPRTEHCATDARHVFRRKAVPTPLVVRVLDGGEPHAHARYQLTIGDRVEHGTTDASGTVRAWLPRRARTASLLVDVDGFGREHTIDLGALDPVNTESGLRHRLQNLRYLEPHETSPLDLRRAVRSFQLDRHLEPTGEPNGATEDALVSAHGS